MAEEIPDNRFKSEVMRLLGTVITKVDGLETKVDGLEIKVGENTAAVRALQNDVRILGGQVQDVASVVIKDTQRISTLEHRVDALEGETH